MRRGVTACVIATLFVAFGGATASVRPAGHHESRSSADTCTSVPLDLTGPRPGVTLTLANGTSYPAIVDTGAMNTTVNIEFAERLGVTKDGSLAPPFDKHASGYQTTLSGARIGSLPLPDRSVPVMSSPLPDKAAIISPAAFSGKLVRLDLKNGLLQVCPKTSATLPQTESYPYSEPPFALPAFPLTIGSQTFQAHLDTGSATPLIFPTALARQLQIAGEWKLAGTARLHSGSSPIYKGKLLGDAKVGAVIVRQPDVASLEIIPGVNIGMGILRNLIVTIDPEEKRSWIELAVPRAHSPLE